MANSPPKVLRLGVFQGERCIEERLLRKRIDVSIGQTLSNTFVVPASSMPKSHPLFRVDGKGDYFLLVNDRMGGRISQGGEVIDLTRLRQSSQARAVDGGYEVRLSNQARGKISFGEIRVLFQFVVAPPVATRMLPSALGGGALAGFSTFLGVPILIGLALSAVLQMGPLFFVMLRDWPEPEGYSEIPDWYLEREIELAEEEEEEEESEEEKEEEEGEGEGSGETEAVNEEIVKEQPKKKDSKESKSTSTPKSAAEVAAEKRMKKSRGKKIVGEVFGVEGDGSIGDSIASNIVGADSTISSLEGLTGSDIGGPGGAGSGDGLGLGLGTGGEGSAGGEPGLKNVEGGGGNKIIGSGPETSEPAKREKAKLKIKTDTKIPSSVASGDKKGIESIFSKKKRHIEGCYKRVIQKYGDQSGKVVVKITIGTDGKVLKVSTTVDEIGKNLSSCIEAKIKRWKFPAQDKPITVAKRWVFG